MSGTPVPAAVPPPGTPVLPRPPAVPVLPLPPPPQPTVVALAPPRIGGGHDGDTFWTGGSNLTAHRNIQPKSFYAHRPTRFKYAQVVYDKCIKPLDVEKRLGPADGKEGIPWTTWVDLIKVRLEELGEDTVMRMLIGNTEEYMLDRWGNLTDTKINAWERALTVTGVNGAPLCRFDAENLAWSGRVIMESVTQALWEMLEKEVGANPTGPRVFYAIVQQAQTMTASLVQTLVEKMKKLSLKQIPAQDVEVLCGIITELCRRIDGSMDPVRNLPSLAAAPFLQCDVEPFRITATRLHERTDEMEPDLGWRKVLDAVKKRFRILKGQGLWSPIEMAKEPDEIATMKAEILVLKQQQVKSMKCYNCGKEGHMSRDCPEPNNNTNSNSNGNNNSNNSPGRTSHKYQGPSTGGSETKTHLGATWKWCDRCGSWRKGPGGHLTAEHRGAPPATNTTPSGSSSEGGASANIAAQGGTAPPAETPVIGVAAEGGLRLQLSGALFMCQETDHVEETEEFIEVETVDDLSVASKESMGTADDVSVVSMFGAPIKPGLSPADQSPPPEQGPTPDWIRFDVNEEFDDDDSCFDVHEEFHMNEGIEEMSTDPESAPSEVIPETRASTNLPKSRARLENVPEDHDGDLFYDMYQTPSALNERAGQV